MPVLSHKRKPTLSSRCNETTKQNRIVDKAAKKIEIVNETERLCMRTREKNEVVHIIKNAAKKNPPQERTVRVKQMLTSFHFVETFCVHQMREVERSDSFSQPLQ